MTRTYDVVHRTRYTYEDEVTVSYGRAHLAPRDAPGQWCLESTVEVTPRPAAMVESQDYFGNRSVYVEVQAPHRELVVRATSRVRVSRTAPDLAVLDDRTWEEARDVLAAERSGADPDDGEADEVTSADDGVRVEDFLLPSPQVVLAAEVRDYAARIFPPGRPVGEAVRDLVRRIHADFRYRPGVTSVSSTLPEVLQARAGVCQDFAHLAVACLRSVGLPARYVSGYLETQPPPGREKLQGADASHAWAAVLLPRLGWVDLDPTNDRLVDASYVVTAWGRDYADVPPLKGVIYTDAPGSTLEVAVDVVPVAEPTH